MELIGGLAKPFSELYFELDRDRSGAIEPADVRDLFKKVDVLKDGSLSRKEFNASLDANLLEFCTESHKLWGDCSELDAACLLKQSLLDRTKVMSDPSKGRKLQESSCRDSFGDLTWVQRKGKATKLGVGGDSIWRLSASAINHGGYQIYKLI